MRVKILTKIIIKRGKNIPCLKSFLINLQKRVEKAGFLMKSRIFPNPEKEP
jgi:hypothetical protein